MSLWCTECAGRVRQRKGCAKHPMAIVERVPPLDGWLWLGTAREQPFNRGNRITNRMTTDVRVPEAGRRTPLADQRLPLGGLVGEPALAAGLGRFELQAGASRPHRPGRE